MASDRSRKTYDVTRQYRSVVPQQGRVMLEADLNEAQEIATEELREEALDFVGPCGTPDDGYKVSLLSELSNADFNISQGTMYVGGLRVVQSNSSLKYLTQPEWQDRPVEVDPQDTELVYLYLREQEVSAVEDSALREVALGGPDTAQRTRLVQHIERINVLDTDTTAALALATAENSWSTNRGLIFEPSTMRLLSKGRLRAAWTGSEVGDLCAPATPTGYLGDENQLIRVQVSATNKIIWGYDNASFLYRATRLGYDPDTDTTTLALASIPVDERHRPRGGQAVEILKGAVKLENDVYIAAKAGQVTTVSQAYDTRTQTIVVNDNVGEGEPVLFVRVWEQELPLTVDPILIGPYGLQVTLSTPGGGIFTVGDYWLIGVRPSTPSKIYPARLESDQPPDGPRRWACPLAVLGMVHDNPAVIVDCRRPFKNLVELTENSCCECSFKVSPLDITPEIGLQALIDGFFATVPPQITSIVVCLDPGTYELPEPLRFAVQHTGLTLDGGSGGVVLKAAAGQEDEFIDGLISLTSTMRVTLRGLELELPIVNFSDAGGTLASVELEEFVDQGGAEFNFQDALTALGVRLFSCTNTTVHGCTFCFMATSLDHMHVVCVGILAQGSITGLAVEGNTFVHAAVNDDNEYLLFGFLLAPSTTVTLSGGGVTSGTVIRPVLDQATLSDNTFSGLTGAAMVYGDLGAVSIERNQVKLCYAGFWLMSLKSLLGFHDASALATQLGTIYYGSTLPEMQLVNSWNDPAMGAGSAIARAYPRPIGASLTGMVTSSAHFSLSSSAKLGETLRLVEVSLVSDLKALVLRVANNDVDTTSLLLDDSGSPMSAAALAVWDHRFNPTAGGTSGNAIISGNRLVSTGKTATAVLVAIEFCTVTGNLVHCGTSSDFSLIHLCGELSPKYVSGSTTVLGPVPPIAVTGNMLQGLSRLPKRSSTLETAGGWAMLNYASPTAP
jgi:Family of unknown function (DUF6519)